MAKFVCILNDEKKENLTEDLVKRHIEHLKNLKHNKILFICGLVNHHHQRWWLEWEALKEPFL